MAVLLWGFFVESTVSTQVGAAGHYVPFTAATTLAGARLATGGFGFPNTSSATPLPFLAAVALLGALAVVAGAAAGVGDDQVREARRRRRLGGRPERDGPGSDDRGARATSTASMAHR